MTISNECERNNVSYPGHDTMENGCCIFCGKWFTMDDDGEWDESTAYATREDAEDAQAAK